MPTTASIIFGVLMALTGLMAFLAIAYGFVTLAELFIPERFRSTGLARKISDHKLQLQIDEQRVRVAARKREDESQQVVWAASAANEARRSAVETIADRIADNRKYESEFEEKQPTPREALDEFEVPTEEAVFDLTNELEKTIDKFAQDELPIPGKVEDCLVCLNPVSNTLYLAGTTRRGNGQMIFTHYKQHALRFRGKDCAQIRGYLDVLERQGLVGFVVTARSRSLSQPQQAGA